jgi:hypothetical protein
MLDPLPITLHIKYRHVNYISKVFCTAHSKDPESVKGNRTTLLDNGCFDNSGFYSRQFPPGLGRRFLIP